ncbi:hypothetical protein [uncultured Amphritea sp.]|mgnify:CR=1 FL=1|uniref:hypothetical protein n=1 Tax=uncultured Amphritea sp. TaxID=981605 RepID=UPI00262C8908|nr:hypothetical protein [uncultured Amphritea sp.]
MSFSSRKNREFRDFKLGVIFLLLIALVLFTMILWLVSPKDMLDLVNFEQWSSVADSINLIIGLPIAFAGAYVAIAIASRTADISARQQSQELHTYYEGLHEQLIDNYFAITQSVNSLVSASNRFEEGFYSFLKRETAAKYSVINFIDDEHKASYIQEILETNRNGITDVLDKLHSDIKSHIQQLINSIDMSFKYSSINETWNISVRAPGKKILLLDACEKGFFKGRFIGHSNSESWLSDAKNAVMERLDLHEVSNSLSRSNEKVHPLLPFCFYISELNELMESEDPNLGRWSPEVLLAGYFLMTHTSPSQSGERVYFNTGALFLADLIDNLPSSEHIKFAFSQRYLETEKILYGTNDTAGEEDLYRMAEKSYHSLGNDSKMLFSMLSKNIQLSHYSPRIRSTRKVMEDVLSRYKPEDDIPLLSIKYELLNSAPEGEPYNSAKISLK